MLLGGKTYKAHELTYAGGLVRCGHCGNLVTGEQVIKKATGKTYVYYRCTMYNTGDHPRVRLTERQLDEQVLAVFRSIRPASAPTTICSRLVWSSRGTVLAASPRLPGYCSAP